MFLFTFLDSDYIIDIWGIYLLYFNILAVFRACGNHTTWQHSVLWNSQMQWQTTLTSNSQYRKPHRSKLFLSQNTYPRSLDLLSVIYVAIPSPHIYFPDIALISLKYFHIPVHIFIYPTHVEFPDLVYITHFKFSTIFHSWWRNTWVQISSRMPRASHRPEIHKICLDSKD